MKKRWRKAVITDEGQRVALPVPIASDASIASRSIGDGKLIPLVILDTSSRPEVEELVKLHEHLPPGDVETQWGRLGGAEHKLALILRFQRPSKCTLVLEFDVKLQGIIVDQIVTAQALYVQPGRRGDRLRTTMDHARILVEVPSEEFREEWERIFYRSVTAELRSRGLTRRQAKSASHDVIASMRRLNQFRMKG